MLKLTRNGQITIPKDMRDQYGLNEGDYLNVSVTSEGILLKPVQVQPRKITMTQIVKRAKKELREDHFQTVLDEDELKRVINPE